MNPRLQLAIALAEQAGETIASAFARRDHRLTMKSANDFATETDQAIEHFFAQQIASAFPGDVLLGEEGGERMPGEGAPTGVRWIVDPLDGTFNFVHSFPYIATSIAIEQHGRIDAGVIANPLTGEVFHAERGGGAWRQRAGGSELQRLQVSNSTDLSSALVGSVLPSAGSNKFESVLSAWVDVARRVGSIRRTGAAALDLAHLSAGQLDGFFVMSLGAWDAAAGALLVQEAGGQVCDFAGHNDYLHTHQVIAGPRAIAESLTDVLRPYATNNTNPKAALAQSRRKSVPEIR